MEEQKRWERPTDEKVLNPYTENWVSQSYAKSQGFYIDARKATQTYYDKNPGEWEAQLIEAGKADPKPDKQLLQDSKDRLTDDERERLDETERIEFDEADGELGQILGEIDQHDQRGVGFDDEEYVDIRVPNIEDFEDPTEVRRNKEYTRPHEKDEFDPQFSRMPTFPGVYTSGKGNRPKGQPPHISERRKKEGRMREESDTNKRYVKTKAGGVRVVKGED